MSAGVRRCPVTLLVAAHFLGVAAILDLVPPRGTVPVKLDIHHAPAPVSSWVNRHELAAFFGLAATPRVGLTEALDTPEKIR